MYFLCNEPVCLLCVSAHICGTCIYGAYICGVPCHHTCGGQKTTWVRCFSPRKQDPGTELRLFGLVSSESHCNPLASVSHLACSVFSFDSVLRHGFTGTILHLVFMMLWCLVKSCFVFCFFFKRYISYPYLTFAGTKMLYKSKLWKEGFPLA